MLDAPQKPDDAVDHSLNSIKKWCLAYRQSYPHPRPPPPIKSRSLMMWWIAPSTASRSEWCLARCSGPDEDKLLGEALDADK